MKKEISKSYAMDSLSDKRWQTYRKVMFRETAFECWTGVSRWHDKKTGFSYYYKTPIYCTVEDRIA